MGVIFDYDDFDLSEPINILRFCVSCLLFAAVHDQLMGVGPLGSREVFFPTIATRLLWLSWICIIISRPMCIAIPIVITFWLIPFLCEIFYDGYCAFQHQFDSAPAIGGGLPGSRWELLAFVKSSNNGYNARQFYPVTICDFSLLDDPFWPHASSVCIIEIRRRSLVWRTITIWEVSLLNGGQKKLHEFDQFFLEWPDTAPWFTRRFRSRGLVRCFQSKGVVFVSFRCFGQNVLYVYDRRYKKAAAYKLPSLPASPFRRFPLAVWCIGRLPGVNGSVEGWRIRWLDGSHDFGPGGDGENVQVRARLINEVFELRRDARSISQEEVLFGNFNVLVHFVIFLDIDIWLHSTFIRTSHGWFGFSSKRAFQGHHGMLFDPATARYVYFSSLNYLLHMDRKFAAYSVLPSPDQRNSRRTKLCPAVLTDRECIECFGNGKVFRAELGVPTLKYLAARALFRAQPDLRQRMNAEQFRQASGIDDMDGHLG